MQLVKLITPKIIKTLHCLLLTFLVLFFTAVTPAFSQDNSPYSRYGLGDLITPVNIINRGMGGLSAGYNDYLAITFSNPASYSNFQSFLEAKSKKIISGRAILDIGVNVDGRTLVVDLADNTAYVVTNSGISIVPIDLPSRADTPLPARDGLVNLSSMQPAISQNGLISIFGQNLGDSATSSANPLPTFLGGLCVTLGQTPVPLIMTSPTQINALIPADATVGRNTLVIRNVNKKVASANIAITSAKAAPAVIVATGGMEALVMRANGEKITKNNRAKRDERLTMFATGLGIPKGVTLPLGAASPVDKVIKTDVIKLYFGDYRYKEAEIIVDSSTFAPGLVGVYQINFRIPGAHLRGDSLPVMIRVGTVDSPIKGPIVPTIAVD